MPSPKSLFAAGAVAALCVAAAGCGSSSSSSTTSSTASSTMTKTAAAKSGAAMMVGGVEVLHLSAPASGALMFEPSALTAKAGKVKVIFANPSPVQHNFSLTDSKGTELGAEMSPFSGGAKSTSYNLKAGTYTFECQVPGHAAAGMKGTLTVS